MAEPRKQPERGDDSPGRNSTTHPGSHGAAGKRPAPSEIEESRPEDWVGRPTEEQTGGEEDEA